MTPTEMKRILYVFFSIIIILSVYPLVEPSFYSYKFTELAVLGPSGEVGIYPNRIIQGDSLPLKIFIENHEGLTQLYRVDIKLVDNITLNEKSFPYEVNPLSSGYTIIEDDKNNVLPIDIEINKPFDGKIVIELFKYDSKTSDYAFHDRWVAIWMKTVK